MIVSGEAGIGKTRLLEEALTRMAAPNHWVAFSSDRLRSPGAGLNSLAVALGPRGTSLAEELDPRVERSLQTKRILDAANDALAGAAGVVVLDDAQWADELTFTWLSSLAEIVDWKTFRLVLGVRAVGPLPANLSDALAELTRRDRVRRLTVEPLSVAAVAALAESQSFAVSAELVEEIHSRSEGLPLAVEELFRTLRSQALSRKSQLDLLRSAEFPVIEAVIREQIKELSEGSREILATAALSPQPLRESILRDVGGYELGEFEDFIDELVDTGLMIGHRHGELRFRHALHREVLQRLQRRSRRRARHRVIAASLERHGARAEELAEQFLGAGEAVKAALWLERAAQDATEAHDPGVALDFVETAFDECSPLSGETAAKLATIGAEAAREVNQPERARRLIDLALTQVTDLGQRGEVLFSASRLAWYEGDFEENCDLLKRAARAFAEAGDKGREAKAVGSLSMQPVSGKLSNEDCLEAAERSVALARESGNPVTLARCLGYLGSAWVSCGEAKGFDYFEDAGRILKNVRADEASRATDRVITLGDAYLSLALGAYRRAEVAGRRGEAITEGALLSYTSSNYAILMWRTGRWDDALGIIGKIDFKYCFPEVRAIATCVEAAIRFERGTPIDMTQIEAAAATLIKQEDTIWAAMAFASLLKIRHARREPNSERGLMKLVELIRSRLKMIGWDDLFVETARIDPSLYQRLVRALGDLRPTGPRADASLLFAQGLAERSKGNPRAAAKLLLEAAEAFERLGEPHSFARATEAAAEARVSTGERAGSLRSAAATIYQELGADRSLALLLRRAGRTRSLRGFKMPASQRHSGPGLTPREREVAALAAQGLATRAIADKLGISQSTAHLHVSSVKRKLNAPHKSDLVRILQEPSY